MLWWMTTALPGFLQTVAPLLDHYGYFGVGALLIVEDLGIPVPGETVLVTAAIYAGTGRLNIVVLALVAIAACVIGDNIGFLIGHYGGERLVRRFGRYVFITPEKLDRTKDFFNRRGGLVVIVARFIDGLRELNGIIAGTVQMRWARFLMYNLIGATLWVGTWLAIGYAAGNNIGPIYRTIQRYEVYALVVLGLAIIGLIARFSWKHSSHASMRLKR
jgi:membrane protein DedA with SNARE-associated domain